MRSIVKKSMLVMVLSLISGTAFGQATKTLQVEVIDFGADNRSKIIKLESQKQQIQDYVSLLKKGMSKAQKDQLTKDLKALRKCKFQQPCLDESGRKVEF